MLMAWLGCPELRIFGCPSSECLPSARTYTQARSAPWAAASLLAQIRKQIARGIQGQLETERAKTVHLGKLGACPSMIQRYFTNAAADSLAA